MSSLSRELVFLILQFLDEEKFKESVHKLEQESGFFFNMKYFEEKAQAGEWDEVEKYLSGFTKVDDNRYSMKIFFEIRKQKYLEALDRHDRAKAVEILVKDLKVFSTFNEELYKEITQLLTLENFRENEQLSKYGDTKSARSIMLIELKKLIEANPLFREKLAFPTLKASRLRTLINQSLNWQHQLCKNPRPNPDIKTLFTDHTCAPTNGARAPTPVPVPLTAVAKTATYTPLGAHGPFPPAAAAASNALAGWMANAAASSSVQSAVVAASSIPVPPNQVSILKRPRTPPNGLGMVDYQSTDSEQLMKRLRSAAPVDEVTYPTPLPQTSWSSDDLPRAVACTINQGSSVTSMDFHPSHQTLLLVGSSNGEISLWQIGLRERLASKPFKIWDTSSCSLPFQAAIGKDPSISISRVTWSPDGSLMGMCPLYSGLGRVLLIFMYILLMKTNEHSYFLVSGIAFTKHLIHLYAYQGTNDLRQHLEIDAHVGKVNDLAFSHPNKQLCVVTCGDDKLIKVWDLNGRRLYNFEGHDAPVYSVCPHHKESIQFIFSTALDGKIKAWLYDNMGSRVDYDAPGRWCTTMLYSADGSRLFSCGTSKDGDSYLVEWNESEGAIKRTYTGFRKKSAGVVQFDTTQNHFLAVGEDSQIKFWDMDNVSLLTATDAEGGLPSLPRLRFNKEGNLLAVTTADNGFKILANADGLRALRLIESRSFDTLRAPIEPAPVKVSGAAVVANSSPNVTRVDRLDRSSPARPSSVLNGVDQKPRVLEDMTEKTKPWELAEVMDPAQCRVVTMPDSADPPSKVARLLYTNSGVSLLALGSNAIQKLWKWSRSEQNPSGKATAGVAPQHWQPNSGLLMTNDVSDTNPEEAVPCIALSKNDSYVMSACGGKVSLFNMMTFKVMTTFMPPPPASTFLAFHPQDNNIIAIGMEDSTIHIYNVRVDEVKTKLRGHQKRITGLAFSNSLNILVSSGADAQLCVWNTDTWEKRRSIAIQLPAGKAPAGDTRVQFHSDQIRLLVFHETQLAIYDASKIERIRQWVPQDLLSAPISYAVYSCNSQLVYAAFCDGNIGVFDADSLRLRCRIAPSAYLSAAVTNSQPVYPLVIAAHPHEPNQLAIGMTDGAVRVMEPSESEGKWGVAVPIDNGLPNGRTTASSANSNTAADQLQR
ncbi:protein TPR1 isoform X2 [Magnolia sinica]|uniref:protein TPR1 isoform X2 n=1 Tax=Magnolia sinica TaxID=86752 RepID=UPI002659332F|nr:protein TPR1 isoform X2 [Magnolia sinica]